MRLRNIIIIIVILLCLSFHSGAQDRNFKATIIGVTDYGGDYKPNLQRFRLDKAACTMSNAVQEIAKGLGFNAKDLSIDVLIDTNACEKTYKPTSENIKSSVTAQLSRGKEDDVFVFYFTGHGADLSLLTSKYNPFYLHHYLNRLRLSEINEIITDLKYPGHIFMFFDTCRVQSTTEQADGIFNEVFKFRSIFDGKQEWNVWYASSFPSPAYIDNVVHKQKPRFGGKTDYGYFTKYIVKLLSQQNVSSLGGDLEKDNIDGCIDEREFSRYISKEVRNEVEIESNYIQEPTPVPISRSNKKFCLKSNSLEDSLAAEKVTISPLKKAIADIRDYGTRRNKETFYCDKESVRFIRTSVLGLGRELRSRKAPTLLLDYKRQIYSAFAFLIASSTEHLYEDGDNWKIENGAISVVEMARKANKLITKCEKESQNIECQKLLNYANTGDMTPQPWNFHNLAHAHGLLADILTINGDQLKASSHTNKMLEWFDIIGSLPEGNRYIAKWFLDPEPYLFRVCSRQQRQQNNVCNIIVANYNGDRYKCNKVVGMLGD